MPKQVLTVVTSPVSGSYIWTCRLLRSMGNAWADGWVDPGWQKAGVSAARTRAAIHTRARLSMAKLWATLRLCQMTSSPQYGDDIFGGVSAEFGVSASRTCSGTTLATWVLGSTSGMSSVLFSGAP